MENRLPEDSLKRIVKIMEFIAENREQVTAPEMEEKFGKRDYTLFTTYCVGNWNDSYADTLGNTKNFEDGKGSYGTYKFTQVGFRKLHELRKNLNDEVMSRRQRNVNRIIAFTGSAVVLASALNILVIGITQEKLGIFKWLFISLAAIIAIFTFAFMLLSLIFLEIDKQGEQ